MNTNYIKVLFGSIVTALSWYLGGIDGVLMALLAFITIDYITGVLAAAKEHKLSSEVGFWGLVRKVCILALVGIGNLLDQYVITSGAVFRTVVALYYIGNEGLSIVENMSTLGLPVPEKIRNALAQLKSNSEDEQK